MKTILDIVGTQDSGPAVTKEQENVKIDQMQQGVEAHGVKWLFDETGALVCQGDSIPVTVN